MNSPLHMPLTDSLQLLLPRNAQRHRHQLASQVDQQQADFHFKDADKYRAWLTQLQKRALGLISRGIHSLLDGAAQQATDLMNAAARQRKLQRSSSISVKPSPSSSSSVDEGGLDNAPLESRPVYKKFRGLGFRVRILFCFFLLFFFVSLSLSLLSIYCTLLALSDTT